jgi:hypothetical protein
VHTKTVIDPVAFEQYMDEHENELNSIELPVQVENVEQQVPPHETTNVSEQRSESVVPKHDDMETPATSDDRAPAKDDNKKVSPSNEDTVSLSFVNKNIQSTIHSIHSLFNSYNTIF